MTPEKQVENRFRTQIQHVHGWCVKFFASPSTNKGVPDILGVINGRFCAFEIKRPSGGKPTPVQLWNLQQIANAGGFACVSNDPSIVNYVADPTRQPAGEIMTATFTAQPSVKTATATWGPTKGLHTLILTAP